MDIVGNGNIYFRGRGEGTNPTCTLVSNRYNMSGDSLADLQTRAFGEPKASQKREFVNQLENRHEYCIVLKNWHQYPSRFAKILKIRPRKSKLKFMQSSTNLLPIYNHLLRLWFLLCFAHEWLMKFLSNRYNIRVDSLADLQTRAFGEPKASQKREFVNLLENRHEYCIELKNWHQYPSRFAKILKIRPRKSKLKFMQSSTNLLPIYNHLLRLWFLLCFAHELFTRFLRFDTDHVTMTEPKCFFENP